MTVSQRDIVFTATTTVFAKHKVSFTESQTVAKDVCTSDLRKEITQSVMAAFKAKQVDFKDTEANQKKMALDSELSKYVSGLITNWFNKDSRLNGGQGASKTVSKGGNRGSSDPEIKRLRNLHKTLVAAGKTSEASVVESEIAQRLQAVKASKTKSA
jgi:hypothetical protein